MKIYKSLFSTAIAFLLAVESTLSVSAETVCYQNNSNNLFEVATCIQNNQATKKIGDYDCWSINGQYYTILNDEICQVINLDELNWEYDTYVTQASSVSSQNNNEIDLSSGNKYQGKVDISKTNFTTPTFIGYKSTTQKNKISYSFHTEYFFPNKYSVKIYGYDPILKKWMTTEDTFVFDFFGKTKVLFNGTTGVSPSKIYITFLKSGSTGEPVFNYWFYATQS